jgi:hypothetical protein
VGSILSSEKVILLLDHRGEKELAGALRPCRLERSVEGAELGLVSIIKIYAPLNEYEFLRNLTLSEKQTLLKFFEELYSWGDAPVVSFDPVLEIGNQAQTVLAAAIEEQKSLMISVATGEQTIKNVNEEYKKRRGDIARMLKAKGIQDPNTFFDLWGWYKRFKLGDLPTYASRRQFISDLYDPLLERLRQDDAPAPSNFEPTGWAKVDRTVPEIRRRLEQAETEEQFQAVGTLCREALISLAQAVFDARRHATLDGVESSPTDFKRMIEAYIAVELAGASNETARRHAKAAFDLANELQHRRTANFRHAAFCAESTVAVINLVAIVSGRRDVK